MPQGPQTTTRPGNTPGKSPARGTTRPGVALAACFAALLWLTACGADSGERAIAQLAGRDYSFAPVEFHRAAREGDAWAVSRFLDAGMAPDVTCPEGLTTLSAAALAARPDIIDTLIAAGADIDAHQPGGRTPLLLAAETGHSTTIQTLLAAGANPDFRDPEGWTALAIATWHGHLAAIELLAPEAPASELDSALLLASLAGNVASTELLLRAGASVEAVDAEGRTPLMLAARHAHAETCRILLENGANRFSVLGDNGPTPAQIAESTMREAIREHDSETAEKARATADLLRRPPPAAGPSTVGLFQDPRDVIAGEEASDPLAIDAATEGRLRVVESLDNAAFTLPADREPEPVDLFVLVEYRKRPLPFLLLSVHPETSAATFRQLHGQHHEITVSPGENIDDTPWTLVQSNHSTTPAKDDGTHIETSTALIRHGMSFATVTLPVGRPVPAEEPVALIRYLPDDRLLLARPNHQFRLSNDSPTLTVESITADAVVLVSQDGLISHVISRD